MGEKVYVAHLRCGGGTDGALAILAVAYGAPCPHSWSKFYIKSPLFNWFIKVLETRIYVLFYVL